jgi:hypothetical protein
MTAVPVTGTACSPTRTFKGTEVPNSPESRSDGEVGSGLGRPDSTRPNGYAGLGLAIPIAASTDDNAGVQIWQFVTCHAALLPVVQPSDGMCYKHTA